MRKKGHISYKKLGKLMQKNQLIFCPHNDVFQEIFYPCWRIDFLDLKILICPYHTLSTSSFSNSDGLTLRPILINICLLFVVLCPNPVHRQLEKLQEKNYKSSNEESMKKLQKNSFTISSKLVIARTTNMFSRYFFIYKKVFVLQKKILMNL